MKKYNLDIFKLLLIIVIIWIGYSIHNFSNNGRYQFRYEGNGVIDTRTGNYFYYYYDQGQEKVKLKIREWPKETE